MSLRRLEVRDFRCIEATDLEFDGRCNLISGANASGKTSLLEAIFFLGRGRSFRTARNETLIRKAQHELLLTGRFEAGDSLRPVGVRYSREGFEARAAGAAGRQPGGAGDDPAGAGDRPGGASTGRGGAAGAPPVPRLGCVPRGTKVRGALAPLPAGAEAAQRRAAGRGSRSGRPGLGPGTHRVRSGAGSLPPAVLHGLAAARDRRRPAPARSRHRALAQRRLGWLAPISRTPSTTPGHGTASAARRTSAPIGRTSRFASAATWRGNACPAVSRS